MAVVFALERLHQFTYSSLIVACSDHNLLEAITRKPLDREPKRLQGMLLCAPAYDIEVEYLEGKKMFLTDKLCRVFLSAERNHTASKFETVNVVAYLSMRDDLIKDIRDATSQEPTLQVLKDVIQHGWPGKASVSPEATTIINSLSLMVCYSMEKES